MPYGKDTGRRGPPGLWPDLRATPLPPTLVLEATLEQGVQMGVEKFKICSELKVLCL